MNQETNALPKKTLFFLIALLIVGISSATAYALAAILGKTVMSWPIFAGWLGVILSLDGLLLLFLRRNWSLLNLSGKVGTFLWGSVSVWYWSFAVFYFYLNVNADALQLAWTALVYFWEVALIGGLYVLVSLRILRPIIKFIEAKDGSDPVSVYRMTLRYPLLITFLIIGISIFGYFLGAIQIRIFAFSPVIEQVKNVLNGFAVALHLGVFTFLAIDLLMGEARVALGKSADLSGVPRRQLSQKFFAVALIATLASIALLGLIVFKTFQNSIRDHEAEEIELKIKLNSSSWQGIERISDRMNTIEKDIKTGDQGKVYFVEAGNNLPESDFSAETIHLVFDTDSGRAFDLKKDAKVIVFFLEPDTGTKVVSVAFLEEFYQPLSRGSLALLANVVFVAVFLMGIMALLSSMFSRSITHLKNAVQEAEKGVPFALKTGSADEVEDLADAFSLFIGESQGLRANLEKQVSERTKQLEEKMQQLEEVNKVMVGRELTMRELKKEVEELKGKIGQGGRSS